MGGSARADWGQPGDPARCPLQKLPEQWDNNKKLCLRVADSAAPLQAAEAAILRDKCQDFEVPPWGCGWGGSSEEVLGRLCCSSPLPGPGCPREAPCPPKQVQQLAFRESFLGQAPFLYTDPEPYESLNRVRKGRTPGPLLSLLALPGLAAAPHADREGLALQQGRCPAGIETCP